MLARPSKNAQSKTLVTVMPVVAVPLTLPAFPDVPQTEAVNSIEVGTTVLNEMYCAPVKVNEPLNQVTPSVSVKDGVVLVGLSTGASSNRASVLFITTGRGSKIDGLGLPTT